jgi:Protein of unknown function (DUF1501)
MRNKANRRDFLRASGAGLALGALSRAPAAEFSDQHAVIFLMMVGGPSQLETWDPKPDAPSEVRGPFRSIATAVPGIRVNEFLPRIARRMDRLTLIRSLHHDAAPIHETGHQLLQTGKLCRPGTEHPYIGSVVASRSGSAAPASVILPTRIGHTGVSIPQGQSAGPLGKEYEPFVLGADPNARGYNPSRLPLPPALRGAFDLASEPDSIRDAYGRTTFGQSCLLARRLVESGVRVVTVNMFESVFHQTTWDCHGSAPFSTLDDYRRRLLPTFDLAYAGLLDDLERSGRLGKTLVVATGEFGRSPRLNHSGGRDHWPQVWSAVLAGGGVRGGQVIGASDRIASEPADRPITPAELLATVYRSLEIEPIVAGAGPIAEAFA